MNVLKRAFQKEISKNPCCCSECETCEYWATQAAISEMGAFNNILLDEGKIDLQESIEILNSEV